MKNILLIEDDHNLTAIIRQSLSGEFSVTCASTLAESFRALEAKTFEVVLIDRMLPDGDAIEVIEYLHQTSFQTKIIALSRLFQPAEKIRGLESGADDYLPKPFSLAELKLKIRKTANYEKRKQTEYFSTGKLQFFPDSGEVLIDGTIAKLRRKEADILLCLFRYKNRVVSRDTIVDEVWSNHDSLPTQTTLDVYIRRLRILLQEYGRVIVTKRGFGYMLIDV
jgi:DNA-binding response OmpR family regulator